ncbi:hypothetical protein OAE45_03745 [Candidatus Thioglobus sp.]|nr:hypothetical protein [Candidatus Thioglobus sp.]MDC3216568.1 hypothetical protein [Candidatus Pseudothioglobus singularis]
MTDEFVWILLVIGLMAYWSFRGLIGLFQRYNTILIILYLIILFPIAFLHMFVLGIFGDNKKERELNEAKKEAERQVMVEKEKENLQK